MKLGTSLVIGLIDVNWFVSGIVGRKCFVGRGRVRFGAFLVVYGRGGGLRYPCFLTTQSLVQVRLQESLEDQSF